MSEWYPEPKHPGSAALAAPAGGLSEPQMPELTMPNPGDTIKLAIEPWGHTYVLGPNSSIQQGHKVIVLEVKEVKTAKVVLE